MKYFYIVDEPARKVMFMWNAYSGEMDRGLVSDATSAQHIRELADGQKQVGSISAECAKALVDKELARLRTRCAFDAESRRLFDSCSGWRQAEEK